MFWRRKSKGPQPLPAPEAPVDQRALYRPELPEGHGLRVILERPDAPLFEVTLRSLTFRGAGLEAWAADAVHVGDVFDVTVWSEEDSWSVRTPAAVRRVEEPRDRVVSFGIEFINLGSLYGQMDDALGQYFNRRVLQRVQPFVAEPVTASLSSHGHWMRGTVHDLTALGVGLLVDHVLAVPLTIDAGARVTLELPTCEEELGGRAFIRQRRRLREKDLIGLEFDAADEAGFPAHAAIIDDYCAEREQAMQELDDGVEWAA